MRYRLAAGDAEQARKTLDRSLQSLPPFEHIRMISQAGLLEFKLGDAGAWVLGAGGAEARSRRLGPRAREATDRSGAHGGCLAAHLAVLLLISVSTAPAERGRAAHPPLAHASL